MAKGPVLAVCYNLPANVAFFRSVAVAMAFQRNIQLEWGRYRDERFINTLSAA